MDLKIGCRYKVTFPIGVFTIGKLVKIENDGTHLFEYLSGDRTLVDEVTDSDYAKDHPGMFYLMGFVFSKVKIEKITKRKG